MRSDYGDKLNRWLAHRCALVHFNADAFAFVHCLRALEASLVDLIRLSLVVVTLTVKLC